MPRGNWLVPRPCRACLAAEEAKALFLEGLTPDRQQYLWHLEATHPKGGFPINLRPSGALRC
jgi:hypothetical protein